MQHNTFSLLSRKQMSEIKRKTWSKHKKHLSEKKEEIISVECGKGTAMQWWKLCRESRKMRWEIILPSCLSALHNIDVPPTSTNFSSH